MLLGIISDTHGNVEAIQEVATVWRHQVDQVLHLGDDYLDILFLEAADLQGSGGSGPILSGISGSDHSEPAH